MRNPAGKGFPSGWEVKGQQAQSLGCVWLLFLARGLEGMRLMRSTRTTAHGLNFLREVGVSDRSMTDKVWEQLRKYPFNPILK